MSRTAIVVALALVLAAGAAATPPPGKGKPTTGPGCKPQVAVVLTGTVSQVTPSFKFTVTGGNNYASAYVKLTQPIDKVTVSSTTKVIRQGKKTSAVLAVGDRVNIQAKACRADLANGATPSLAASRITAKPSK